MKKLLLLLMAFMGFAYNAIAQLEVKPGSFKEVPGFVNLDLDKQTDDNDQPYAVLKVKTENINDKQRRELNFQGDARTFFELEYRDGEVWLYISYYATYIKISHPDFSSTEFYFPFDMMGKKGYELTLVNKMPSGGKGVLTIKSKPENGAMIVLNGSAINQKTPYTNNMIASGHYDIIVAKERFKSGSISLDIQDGETREVEIEMLLDVAEITLEADNLTDIYIDGEFVKRGTWKGELYSGSHEIMYKKDNYHDATKTIVVEPGVSVPYSLDMKPLGYEISVTTEPLGAMVFIDGKEVGLSPFKASLPSGKHTISAYKDNETASKDIKIEAHGGAYEVVLVMQKESLGRYAKVGYKFVTLNGSINPYNDLSYGLTFGMMKKYGWFISAMTNLHFQGLKSDYECDDTFLVDGNDVAYTGKESYTSLSVMAGFLMRIGGPVALRVGAGYGVRNAVYETQDGKWVKNTVPSAQGLDVSLGLQCNFKGFIISVDGVATNFKVFEAKIGLGYGFKNK